MNPPNDSPTVALSLKNIHKTFGDKVVHRGVSFDLFENEILGLFGGSGTSSGLNNRIKARSYLKAKTS